MFSRNIVRQGGVFFGTFHGMIVLAGTLRYRLLFSGSTVWYRGVLFKFYKWVLYDMIVLVGTFQV